MNRVEVTIVAMLTEVKGRGGIASRFSGRLAQVSGGELVKAERGEERVSSSAEMSREWEGEEEGERGEPRCSNKDLLWR